MTRFLSQLNCSRIFAASAPLALLLTLDPGVAAAASAQQPAPAATSPRNVGDGKEEVTDVRRFALFVGANDGGGEREILRYAGTDASSIRGVLSELGGVPDSAHKTLLEPDQGQLEAAFAEMAQLIGEMATSARTGRARPRIEFVFYYSGHSDENGLLLGGKALGYRELRNLINRIPADVHIAVLDSCESGAFTRLKGGRRAAPFLVAGSGTVKGHAFLTSSSADEAAQESDRLGASFFTHYLVTGLRGAADVDQDGLVTVNEAYQFARNETLSRTEISRGGPQHAAYDLQLAGTGDLVLTNLREATAKLEVAAELEGRVYVRDESGRLVAEFFKSAAAGPMELALVPGRYSIIVDDGSGHWKAELTVGATGVAKLNSQTLAVVETEVNRERGNGPTPEAPVEEQPSEAEETESEWVHVPFAIGLAPRVSSNYRGPDVRVRSNFDISLGASHFDRLDGVGISLGAHRVDWGVRGAHGALGMTYTGGDLWGVQYSLGLNRAVGDVHGLQDSLGGNFAGGTVRGVQGALGINTAGAGLQGVQAALGANIVKGEAFGMQAVLGANVVSEHMTGIQGALGGNVTRGRMRGVQGALGVNFAREVQGIQATLGANIASVRIRGIQAALGGNYASVVEGMQTALSVNVTKELRGVQAGFVNITKGESKGLQIGLVNYADSAKASIALLPIVKKGIGAEVWTSDTAALNVGLRFDAEYTYAIWTLGLHPGGAGKAWMPGFAFGVQIRPIERLRLALDLHGQLVFDEFKAERVRGELYIDSKQQLLSLRLMASWNFLRRLAVVAGPTLTTQFDADPERGITRPGYQYSGRELAEDSSYSVRIWAGFMAGIRI